MTEIRSDEQLRASIAELFIRFQGGKIPMEDGGKQIRKTDEYIDRMLDLFKSQNRAYADMVIGDNIKCDGTCDDSAHESHNRLIAEQRARNVS